MPVRQHPSRTLRGRGSKPVSEALTNLAGASNLPVILHAIVTRRRPTPPRRSTPQAELPQREHGRESQAVDAVTREIRELVVRRQLSPGEQMRQAELATYLGLSRR